MSSTTARYPLWESLNQPSAFGQKSRSAVRAEGVRVLYADGQWRLCGTSGLWNVSLGYNNPRIADAISAALRESSYFTLFRAGHELAVAASRALLGVCGSDHFGRVAFSTSGGAANDLTMKLVRQYWSLRRQYRRRIVVGLRNSYHGLTYGSHGLTGSALGQNYYSVDRSLIRHVAHDDPEELAELLRQEGDQVAAVVVEPVLGTGAEPLSPAMLDGLRALREEHGFLLVADEVATGFGRTGPYFASSRWPVQPDVLLCSKALTNGTCPAAAVVVSHQLCDAFERADAALIHAETSAGTPSTCAAILATIDEMERLGALANGRSVSAGLDSLLAGLSTHPLVAGSTGVGCFRALKLAHDGVPFSDADAAAAVEEIRAAGAVVSPGPACVQLAPALVYEEDDVRALGDAVRSGLDRMASRQGRSRAGVA